MSLDGALDLSMKVLSKTLDMTKLTSDKIEVATLKRVDGKTKIHVLTTDEMNALIAKFEAEEKKAEEELQRVIDSEIEMSETNTELTSLLGDTLTEYGDEPVNHGILLEK